MQIYSTHDTNIVHFCMQPQSITFLILDHEVQLKTTRAFLFEQEKHVSENDAVNTLYFFT